MPAASVILTPRQLKETWQLHPKLWLVFLDIMLDWDSTAPLVITRIGATREEDEALGGSGIHAAGPPWRALDFGIRALGSDFQARADALSDKIAAKWIYDPARPHLRVLVTKPHGTGPHGHVQVGGSTTRVEAIA